MKKIIKILAIVIIITVTTTSTNVLPVNYKIVEAAKVTKKKVKLVKKKATIRVGQTLKLKLNNAKVKKIKWSSSNKKVANVSKKGVVKAFKKGKVTITAKYKGKKYRCKITIKKALKPGTNAINGSTLKQSEFLIDNLYDGKNIVVSPTSLNMVIGMVANGATEVPKADCETYLGKTVDKYNKYSADLMKQAENDPMLNLANAVWYKKDYIINQNFYDAVTQNYKATVKSSPLDSSTVKEINQWAFDNTDGMIEKVIDKIPLYTSAILTNALLFDGKWTSPFEADDTWKQKFTKLDNKKIKVKMMHDTEKVYYENDFAVGFEKYYGKNKKYSFIAILPKVKGDFNLANLDLDTFLNSKSTKYKVHISMPKFSYSWDGSLNVPLKKTSLKSVYDMYSYPLNNMLTTSDSVYLSDILQSCKIIVDEKGTKAAAVTVGIAKDTCAPVETVPIKEVNLNRPFGYIIMDNTTNDVLFMGKVIDPTQK